MIVEDRPLSAARYPRPYFIRNDVIALTNYDALIVGAGYAGAVAARRLAEDGNKKVLVLERRDHVGGNAYDCLDASGILIHQYLSLIHI